MTDTSRTGAVAIREEPPLSAALKAVQEPELIGQRATDSLRSAIIQGALPPGKRLIERELCEALGVSRTSIREALRRLEVEHLIDVTPRKGPTVARVTIRQAEQIYDLRAHLESDIVERFVTGASDEEIAELRRLFHSFERSARKGDITESVQVMAYFYDYLCTVTDCDVIKGVLSQLTARVSYLRATTMSKPDRIHFSLEELGNLVDLIERRDIPGARAAAEFHVRQAERAALSVLKA